MTKKDQTFIIESPMSMTVGEDIRYSIEWLGADSISSTVMTVYRNGKDVTSATVISGDSFIITNNVVTLKAITALSKDADDVYIVAIQNTVDGNTEIRKLIINIISQKE